MLNPPTTSNVCLLCGAGPSVHKQRLFWGLRIVLTGSFSAWRCACVTWLQLPPQTPGYNEAKQRDFNALGTGFDARQRDFSTSRHANTRLTAVTNVEADVRRVERRYHGPPFVGYSGVAPSPAGCTSATEHEKSTWRPHFAHAHSPVHVCAFPGTHLIPNQTQRSPAGWDHELRPLLPLRVCEHSAGHQQEGGCRCGGWGVRGCAEGSAAEMVAPQSLAPTPLTGGHGRKQHCLRAYSPRL